MTATPPAANTLFYDDNLPILRDQFSGGCAVPGRFGGINLIYLDPPFNSSPAAPTRE